MRSQHYSLLSHARALAEYYYLDWLRPRLFGTFVCPWFGHWIKFASRGRCLRCRQST